MSSYSDCLQRSLEYILPHTWDHTRWPVGWPAGNHIIMQIFTWRYVAWQTHIIYIYTYIIAFTRIHHIHSYPLCCIAAYYISSMTRPEASNFWAQFTTKTSFGLIKIYNLLRSSGCPRIIIGPKRPPKTWPYVAAGHKGTTPDNVLVLEVAHKSKLVGGFNPSWKICSSKWVHLPQVGMKIKKNWNHHKSNV